MTAVSGRVEGTVVRISPESKADAPEDRYFAAVIQLKQGYVSTAKGRVVTPGMTGEASIQIGKRLSFD